MKQDDMYNLLQKSNQRSKGFEKSYNNRIAVIDKGLKENIEVKNAISKRIFHYILPSLLITQKFKNEVDMIQNQKLSSTIKDMISETIFFSDVSNAYDELGPKGKTLEKVFSYTSTAMNAGTVVNNDSSFKRMFASIDFAASAAIPVTMVVGIQAPPALLGIPFAYKFTKLTGRVNHIASKYYDKMLPEHQKKLDDLAWKYFEYPLREFPKAVWRYSKDQLEKSSEFLENVMNKAAVKQVSRIQEKLNQSNSGIVHNRIVSEGPTNERAQARRKMIEEGITIEGPITMMKDALNKVTEKQMNRIQEQLSNPDARIAGNRIVTKSNIHERSQKGKGQKRNTTVLDLYNPISIIKDRVYASRHGEPDGRETAEGQKNNTVNNNSFVINITGMNKTTAEIANELVPKLKYSLANMSLGAL